MVQVGIRSVQRWIRDYNERGPSSLDEDERGGRRWAYATENEEHRLLSSLRRKAAQGQLLTANQIRPPLEAALGRAVSINYVYKLLGRHDWRKVVPRPRHKEANLLEQMAYKSELPQLDPEPFLLCSKGR